jgi:toxin ParE1/3/4
VRVDDEIERKTVLLAQYPNLARERRVKGTRALIISRTPLIALYHVKMSNVEIRRILLRAQPWPLSKAPSE